VHAIDVGGDAGASRYVAARPKVREAVLALRPHVVHVHFGYSVLAVPHVDPPLVASFYGDDLNGTTTESGGTTIKSWAGRYVANWLAWRSRRSIVVSEGMLRALWLRRVRGRAVVVRDGVDDSVFCVRSRVEARRRLGIEDNKIRIIFPHEATDPNKRVQLALAAVAVLRVSIPAIELWIVNGKPADEMPWYYASADAMIVTSRREGGPSSAKEALACGLPVVSVPVGDLQLAADVPDAMLVRPGTPEALADGLRTVLAHLNEPRRSNLPMHLRLSNTAMQVEAVYRETLSER